MNKKRFYHRCLLAMLLAGGLNVQAASPSLVDDELAIKPPPRSINDVTRMLSDYRQHDDLVRKLTAVADASAPASSERQILFDFYWQRGKAAAELGRIQQQISDLAMATRYGQTGAPEYARALRELALAEALGGNFLSAQQFLAESIKQVPQSSQGQLAGAYSQAVMLSARVGDFEGAQKALSQLESTLGFLKSTKGWAIWSHGWLGSYEKARGDFFALSGKPVEAEAAFRKSMREWELFVIDVPALLAAGKDSPTVEFMRQGIEGLERSIALALRDQGKLVEAEAMARRALEHTLKRAGRFSPDVGRGLLVLSNILVDQGRFAEAAMLADTAVASLLASGPMERSLPVVTARRAALSAQVALGNDRQALAIYEQIQNSVAADSALENQFLRGDLDVVIAWLRTGQAAKAEGMAAAMLERSSREQGARALRTAEIRAFHAMAKADQGDRMVALTALREAVPILIEQVRNDSEAETASARRQQRLIVILERYIRLLADMQAKGELPAGVDAVNEAFIVADFARASSVQRALTRSAARAAISDPALAELARQEQDAQRRANALGELLTQLLAAAPDQQLPAIQARIRNDIETLKQTRDRLKKEISQRFPDYARLVDPPPVNIIDVQKMLQPGEVLLSWYFGSQGAHVWAIASSGKSQFAPLGTYRTTMATEVAKLRKALNPDVATIDQIPPFDVALAHRLYQQLIAPVTDVLAGAKVILAVPHAELGQLPLSLLVTAPVAQPGKDGTAFAGYRNVPWLIRQAAVAQLPSVTALASLRRLPPGDPGRLPFIGFGDPYFSEEQAGEANRKAGAQQVAMRGVPLRLRNVPKTHAVDSAELALLPRLPDTAQEIRDIATALGAEPARDVFLNSAASEKTVFEANLANRRVVMFATHGLVPGELDGLSQPALALSAPKVAGTDGDGLLTQEEILSLKLNADWVVLSACNTAAGEGAGSEAVSGLGRAFFYAGARALLVSNWPVETEASRTLMTDLFRRQSDDASLGKAEALRLAMQGMIDGPGKLDAKTGKPVFSYAHPLFWAPFVLVGD